MCKVIQLFMMCVALMFTSSMAFAQKHVCSKGDAKRTITVELGEKGGLPCGVYLQRQGGKPKRIHQAKHTVGYCEKKAQHTADKLAKQGYTCTMVEVAKEAAPTVVAPLVEPKKEVVPLVPEAGKVEPPKEEKK